MHKSWLLSTLVQLVGIWKLHNKNLGEYTMLYCSHSLLVFIWQTMITNEKGSLTLMLLFFFAAIIPMIQGSELLKTKYIFTLQHNLYFISQNVKKKQQFSYLMGHHQHRLYLGQCSQYLHQSTSGIQYLFLHPDNIMPSTIVLKLASTGDMDRLSHAEK